MALINLEPNMNYTIHKCCLPATFQNSLIVKMNWSVMDSPYLRVSFYSEIDNTKFKCTLWTFEQQLAFKMRARCRISIVLLNVYVLCLSGYGLLGRHCEPRLGRFLGHVLQAPVPQPDRAGSDGAAAPGHGTGWWSCSSSRGAPSRSTTHTPNRHSTITL